MKSIRVGGPSAFTLSLVGFLLLFQAHRGSGQAESGEALCGQPRRLPTPSYESFFGHQPPILLEQV